MIDNYLDRLIDIKDNLIDSLQSIGYQVDDNATLMDIQSTLTTLIEEGEVVDNSIAKGFLNGDITYILDNNNLLSITGTSNPADNLYVLFQYIGADVYSLNINTPEIGSSMFRTYFTNLSNVTFGNNVTSIKSSGFLGCTSLTHLNLTDNITSIYEHAFQNSGLQTINLNKIVNINDRAFRNASNIQSLVIPNTCTLIGTDAFAYCYELTSITIPNTTVFIGDEHFFQCKKLTSFTIPTTMTVIPKGFFNSCIALTNVNIHNEVIGIENTAFYSCTSLISINLKNVQSLRYLNSFSGCTNLTTVSANSLDYIGDSAFESTAISNLTGISDVTYIEVEAFKNCTSLTTFTVPYPTSYLGVKVFESCTSLQSCFIKGWITSILDSTFINCTALEEVEIPHTVTSIASTTFKNCTQNNLVINIHKTQDSISGAPWGATNATINWLGEPTFSPIQQTIYNDFPITTGLTHYFNFENSIDGPIMPNPLNNGDLTIIGYPYRKNDCLLLRGNANSLAYFENSNNDIQTIYFVYKLKDFPFIQSDQTITILIGSAESLTKKKALFLSSYKNGQLYGSTYSSSTILTDSYDNLTDFNIITIVGNNTNGFTVYKNGEIIYTTQANYGIIANYIGIGCLPINSNPVGTYLRNAPFFTRFICAYNTLHTSEEITQMNTYLRTKLNIGNISQ